MHVQSSDKNSMRIASGQQNTVTSAKEVASCSTRVAITNYHPALNHCHIKLSRRRVMLSLYKIRKDHQDAKCKPPEKVYPARPFHWNPWKTGEKWDFHHKTVRSPPSHVEENVPLPSVSSPSAPTLRPVRASHPPAWMKDFVSICAC